LAEEGFALRSAVLLRKTAMDWSPTARGARGREGDKGENKESRVGVLFVLVQILIVSEIIARRRVST